MFVIYIRDSTANKNSPKSHIINPLLTKLVLFCEFMDLDSINTQKKNLANMLSCPYTWSVVHISLANNWLMDVCQLASTWVGWWVAIEYCVSGIHYTLHYLKLSHSLIICCFH